MFIYFMLSQLITTHCCTLPCLKSKQLKMVLSCGEHHVSKNFVLCTLREGGAARENSITGDHERAKMGLRVCIISLSHLCQF